MYIKAKHTQSIDVEIEDSTINELLVDKLYETIGLFGRDGDKGYYLDPKTNKVMCWEEHYTSHSYTVRNVVRDATPLDIAVFTVLNSEEFKKL